MQLIQFFDGAVPSWMVTVVGQQDSLDWAVNAAAPADGPNFHGELPLQRQTPEGLEEMLRGFYDRYRGSLAPA